MKNRQTPRSFTFSRARGEERRVARRFRPSRMVCIGFVLCVALAASSTGQTLTTLVSFGGPNGGYPVGSLIQGTDGNFYGTSANGGTNSRGTVFKVTPGGILTTLYNFCSQTNCTD